MEFLQKLILLELSIVILNAYYYKNFYVRFKMIVSSFIKL